MNFSRTGIPAAAIFFTCAMLPEAQNNHHPNETGIKAMASDAFEPTRELLRKYACPYGSDFPSGGIHEIHKTA